VSARRVAITGLGVVAPLGDTLDGLMTALMAGRSGIRRLGAALADGLRSPIAATADFDGSDWFPAPRLRMLDRVSQLALVAAGKAVADALLDFTLMDRCRCGVCLGTGMGGAETTDEGYHTLYAERSTRIKPYSVVNAMNNAAASWIGLEYGLEGANLTYSTACSSSAVAIGEAARRIQAGDADVMIAGGAEAPLVPGVLRAWDAMRVLATADPDNPATSCRPFAGDRSGLVLGEGAACVILEEWEQAVRRGAPVHGEFLGYGLTSEITHLTQPTVEGQSRTMRAALASAHLDPSDIGYINAHGTATLQNDAVETAAIKSVFGAHARSLPVSSTKSMHGHLLGAAGALEFVITVASLERRVVPPTMHLERPDPACDLDYVRGAGRTGQSVQAAMTNSFAFGGTNAVLIVRAVG
jgi:3-oxoacyl-[acyl-carrier-protein] synthase II